MDFDEERELGGGLMVGRKLLRCVAGRLIHGRVDSYSAALDRFYAAFDDGKTMNLDWEGLAELVPLVPYAKVREAKEKATRAKAADSGGLSLAKELARRVLRGLLIALVEGNRGADPDHKQSVVRSLSNRSLTDAEALKRFADCRRGAMIEDALQALAQAKGDDEEGAGVGVSVLLGAATAACTEASIAPTSQLCALLRFQKGDGVRADLESAEWGLRAWRRLGCSDEPKTETKANTKGKTKANTKQKRPAASPPASAPPKPKKKRPTASPTARAPTTPSAPSPVSASPPSTARPPAAETPTKKPWPLLRTAPDSQTSDRSESQRSQVRFRKMSRVLSFRQEDVTSAVAGTPTQATRTCSRSPS